MNIVFSLKLKRRSQFFWRRIKNCISFNHIPSVDRAEIILSNGYVYSITRWSEYDVIFDEKFLMIREQQIAREEDQMYMEEGN